MYTCVFVYLRWSVNILVAICMSRRTFGHITLENKLKPTIYSNLNLTELCRVSRIPYEWVDICINYNLSQQQTALRVSQHNNGEV